MELVAEDPDQRRDQEIRGRPARRRSDAAPASAPPRTFDELYRAERAGLLALALGLTGDPGAAEELVQEAFLRAHRNWNRVAHLDRPGAWVRRVLLNLATSRFRRLSVEARGLVRLRAQAPRPEVVMAADSGAFWEHVRALPRRQAQVVALYYGEDRPVAEIAEILETAEGTVRAQLTTARRTLAAQLGAEDEP